MKNALIAVLLLLAVLAACSVESEKVLPVKLGIIAPLTGGQAYTGELLRVGYEIATQEVNAEGGINGRPLQLLYEDDTGDPKLAVTAYQKLVQTDGVKIVLPLTSSAILAVAPLAEKDKVISFGAVGSSTKIAKAGDYTFRIREKGELHGIAAAEYAINKGWKNAALLYAAHENGVSYSEAFEKKFKELGGKIVFSQSHDKDANDFRTELTKIKETKPDLIYAPGFVKTNAQQLKQIQELGLKISYLTTVAAEDEQLLKIAGTAAEGVIYTSPKFDPYDSNPLVQNFMNEYRKRTNNEALIVGAANAYDSIQILAKVLRICGENTECLKTELYKIQNYHGVGGEVSFDSDGEVVKPIMLKTVKNGKFARLE